MPNEATIQSSLQILFPSGVADYRGQPTQFNADVGVDAGPYVGVKSVTQAGINIDLSALTSLGGFCRFHNQDTVASSTNYVEVGAWDGTAIFFPLLELLPGETYVVRLSRNLGEEFGTGTGTTGAGNNFLRLKAFNATVNVLVEAFNK